MTKIPTMVAHNKERVRVIAEKYVEKFGTGVWITCAQQTNSDMDNSVNNWTLENFRTIPTMQVALSSQYSTPLHLKTMAHYLRFRGFSTYPHR